MAWVYTEQFFQAGDIHDPRDFNRNLQPFVAEIAQFDRDNLQQNVVTSAKITAPTLATSGNKTTFTGQFNKITMWEEGTTTEQIEISANMNAGISISDLGGSFTTDDSALIIDFSAAYDVEHTVGGGALAYINALSLDLVLFRVVLDDLVIAETGELSGNWWKHFVQLYAFTQVGAGTHDVRVQVAGYRRDNTVSPVEYDNHDRDLFIDDRTLIVREVKR